MIIKMIAAIDQDKGIGINNSLPWHISEDMSYFRKMTSHSTVVMGRKTYESIGRALPNRQNIILSRQRFTPSGVKIINSLEALWKMQLKEVWIIGGAQVYKLFLDHASWIFLTRIEQDYKCDTFFPDYEDLFKQERRVCAQSRSDVFFECWRRY